MPWRWGPPNGRHSCLGLIASPPYSGRRVFFLLLSTRRPTLANLVVPLFLIAPPFYTIGGAISFYLLIIMSSSPAYHPRRMSLSSTRADAVRFFGGFIWILDRLLARPAVPHPSAPYPTRCPVMLSPSRLAHRLALRFLIAPRPVPRHAGRGGVLARSCGAFHVRTPWYNPPSLLIPSLIASPACSVAPCPSILERLRLSASDCGNGCCGSLLSARLSVSFVSFMLAPPNRHGKRGERRGELSVLDAGARSACPLDCVG